VCEPILPGNDPDTECNPGEFCNGAGICAP
jgi:hypothetical protein